MDTFKKKLTRNFKGKEMIRTRSYLLTYSYPRNFFSGSATASRDFVANCDTVSVANFC